MDFLRFDGQEGPIRDFTVVSAADVCIAQKFDTWQILIVYLSSKEACPTISINKKVRLRYTCTLMSHGRPWTAMELAKIHTSFSCQLQVNAARVSHFLDAETCDFSKVPSLSMGVHGLIISLFY